jgi:hypothetical protein
MAFFVLHVVVGFARSGDALKDPGVGWHLQAGRSMLASWSVPHVDVFSYTAAGRPWVDYYWLFELVSAACERVAGLPLVATVWMLVYAAIPLVLYRNVVRAGASPLAALLLVPVAHVALLSHAFTRPHVVTYLAFAVVVGALADVEAGRRDVRVLWWLVPLATVWANMHGGFMVGLAAVGLVAGAMTAQAILVGDRAARRRGGALALLLVAMALATVVNPYGIALHRQAFAHVGWASTGRFVEFKSPDFRAGGAAIGCFELLVLGVIVAAGSGTVQLGWGTVAVLVAMLHLALTAARNVNLFVLAATPVVARAVTTVLAARLPELHARWRQIGAEQESRASWRVQVAIVSLACVALTVAGRSPFPTTLDGLQISRGAVAYVDAHAEHFTRLFNTDGLGGALIERFWPRLRVFVDDRTPVYGEAFMADYFTVFDGGPGWQSILDRWGVTSAIVATGTPIAPVLRASPAWTVDYEDEQTLVGTRTSGGAP